MPTPPEEKIRVNARIPKSLYDFICLEYDNVSQAIYIGLENLRDSKTGGYHTDTGIQDDIRPDIQVLTARLEETERVISILQEELDKAGQDKENLKETHKNYMLQVQTLINQKAIEAPGNKKPWWQFW